MHFRDLPRHPGAFVALAFAVLGFAATIGIVVYLRFTTKDISTCSGGELASAPLFIAYLVGSVGAFLAGGLVTRVPGLTRQSSDVRLGRAGSPGRRNLQMLLVLVLLVLVILLGYEAWSLSPLNTNTAELWPITYFVRCASRLAWIGALPVVAAMCAFFGKWLWYQPTVKTR